MGKKVKAGAKKAKQREPRAASSDAGSGDVASQEGSNPTGEEAVSASGREQCGHYGRDSLHLDKVLREIMSPKHAASCEHCREEAPRKKGGGGGGGKDKGGKQQKKKGGGSKGSAAKSQVKAEKSDMWVCLDCGRQFCGGAVSETKPYGHARRHAKQDRHWWAARYDEPTIAYCVSCENEVSIEMPIVEKVVAAAAAADDKVVAAVDSNALGLTNCHGNVVRGLPNLGNTCFFNAVLQSLLALDRLRREMLGPDVPAGALTMSLKKLFVETSASNDAGGGLSPKSLFSSISSKYPQFKGYQMQDSHELLRCFLDGLRTEETEARKLVDDASNAGVPTIVDSVFGGQLSSTVSSTECTHGSVKQDQILDLSLPVPSRRPPEKSVSSPPAKRTKQSVRERSRNRKFGKITTRESPTVVESSKEKIQTVAECNDSQIPGSELGQVISGKELEPSEGSESCASVPNQELKAASNVEDGNFWLDYVDNADETKSEILDSACSAEAGQICDSKDVMHGPFDTRDDALPKEQAPSFENSGENIVDDATPSQPVVILLPYKEFDVTANEMDGTSENSRYPKDSAPPPAVSPEIDNNAYSAFGGDGDQDDYAGLGDMFNEPEVTSEAKKETGTAGDIDVMAWSSNSADDEVDDSNAPISIEGCLTLYTEPELLSESWHCEHCSSAVAHLNTNKGKEDQEMVASADERKESEEMVASAIERKDSEEMMTSANERKDSEEMMTSANERKDSEEMMASGDQRQDGDNVIASCSKRKDTDQIMATDGCSDNVNPGMRCKEGVFAKPPLVDAENTSDANSPDIGNVTVLKTGAMFAVDKTELPDCKTYHNECKDLNNLAVEFTSSSKPPHDSVQHNDARNVEVAAEEISAPVACDDNDSASCSTTSDRKVESDTNAEEVMTCSLPSETQKILPGGKDNEYVTTRNQGRRKRIKMIGKAHQGQDDQNKQKEDETKVFRAAMRRILISKVPPVLTINLNRFSQDSHGRFKKLKGHVRFKETLDVRPYMDPRSKDNGNTTYRLVAVVEHMGNMSGGHYVAYVRGGKIGGRQQQNNTPKSWFYASDTHVREASLQEVLNCEAYILFYERVEE